MPAGSPTAKEYEARLALQPVRAMRAWERMVLVKLVEAAILPQALTTSDALDAYRVREMLDGGMGSIRFVSDRQDRRSNTFTVAELWYTDRDGVLVSFALNLDNHGGPWEIDAWKVDSSALQHPPSLADIRSAP